MEEKKDWKNRIGDDGEQVTIDDSPIYLTEDIINNIQGEIDWCEANMNEWGDDYSAKEKGIFIDGLKRVIKLFEIVEKQI